MLPKSILLHARDGKLCPHLGAARAGRYIGRTADTTVGGPDQCAWPASPEGERIALTDADGRPLPDGIEHFTFYKGEALAGCLWAGDEATAKAFGVTFDPKFGGEFAPVKTSTTKQPPALATEGKA